MKTNLLLKKTAILLSFLLLCTTTVHAQEQITIKWKGGGAKMLHVAATENKKFFVNWGNGDPIHQDEGKGYGFLGLNNIRELETPTNYEEGKEYEITVKGDKKLLYLSVGDNNFYNKVTYLDLSKAPSLKGLIAPNNLLTNLDISNNKNLEVLDYSGNTIPNLNMSNNTKLKMIGCRDNGISSWDISRLTSLTNIDCSGNMLTLSDLYVCGQMTKNNETFLNFTIDVNLGTQTLPETSVAKEEEIDLSAHAMFEGVATSFIIENENGDAQKGIHYTLADNKTLRFLVEGKYTITMTNSAIKSRDISGYNEKEVAVIAPYNVSVMTSIDENEAAELQCYVEGNRLYANNIENDTQVIVYSLNGQQVLQTLYSEGVDLGSLPNGVYLLKTINMENTRHAKFIKK